MPLIYISLEEEREISLKEECEYRVRVISVKLGETLLRLSELYGEERKNVKESCTE
jgi:hypothetical protein